VNLRPSSGGEALELLQRLAAEVGAVDEKEDAACVRVLHEAVADVRRGEGLAGAGSHLDERARTARGERLLEIGDGAELGGPEAAVGERRERAEAVAEGRSGGVAAHLLEPGGERLRPVEREDGAACRVGVERVREAGLRARGLVGERERALERGRDLVGQAVDVLRALPLHPGQRLTFLLRLDDAGGGAVDEEEIVGTTVRRLQDELAHGDTPRRGEVGARRVLNRPAR
jgi:hypothetical protein